MTELRKSTHSHGTRESIPDLTLSTILMGMALPDKLNDLLVFIHVAAARAFRVKRTDGYSEVVRECLNEVERTIERLKRNGLDMEEDIQHMMAIFQSAYAVSSMAFVELGRISKIDGEYEKALHYFAMADEYYQSMTYPIDFDDAWPFEAALWPDSPLEGVYMPHLEGRLVENRFGYLRMGLSDSVKEMVDVFELVKSKCDHGLGAGRHRIVGGSQVPISFDSMNMRTYMRTPMRDTKVHHGFLDFLGGYDRILVTMEDTQTWVSYWSQARGWVSAQLSPVNTGRCGKRMSGTLQSGVWRHISLVGIGHICLGARKKDSLTRIFF